MSNNLTYYVVKDNRGTKPDLMPHEAFSVVKVCDGVTLWTEHFYTQKEAQASAERYAESPYY